jgi:hypothetical protein
MTLRLLALAAALVPLAACAQMMADEAGNSAAADIPPGQVVGESVSCVDTRRVRSTNVHGDETIDFEMVDGTVYRNVLPNRCYSLGFEERFAYQTPTGRLCSTDTITVLHADGSRGTTCGLGEFLPMELTRS